MTVKQKKEDNDELDTYFANQKIKIPETESVSYVLKNMLLKLSNS